MTHSAKLEGLILYVSVGFCIGVLFVFWGVMFCFSVIGIFVGVPMIIVGIVLGLTAIKGPCQQFPLSLQAQ